MAIVTFSALISDIRGRIDNYIYSYQRGTHYIRSYVPHPTDPKTERMQEIRGWFSDLTASWHTLPQTAIAMWNKYGSHRSPPRTGYAMFVGTNMFLYSTGIATLTRADYPPSAPGTPTHVQGFQVTAPDANTNILSWDAPQAAGNYIQALKQYDWNYYPGYNQAWVQLDAVPSTNGQITHTHDTPTGAKIHYKLRSFDAYARKSPFTHVIIITVPA